MAWVGLLVPSPEVVNNAAFIVIFPLTFVANTFVPLDDAARAAADLRRVEPGLRRHPGRPRELFGNIPPDAPAPDVVVAAAPGALHADLGGDLPAGVRAAGQPAVPPLGQPLTGAGPG